ncbi:MAG: serine protease [Caldilineaceae bacterium]|nr:serine protease [Caldilineaceae bacterium]
MVVSKSARLATLVLALVFVACLKVQPSVLAADEVPATPAPLSPTLLNRNLTIVGGQPASPGEWPWQAFIRSGPYMCGGSLIHREWVVTAAHCVVDSSNNVVATGSIHVTLGEHWRNQTESTEQRVAVTKVVVHPNYNARSYDYDIALLQLATAAIPTNAVQTILPVVSTTDDALVAAGTLAVITGWGATSEGGMTSPELLEATVPIVSTEQCNQVYGAITGNMLCAGYAAGGVDSCQGDSGGPLVVPTAEQGWKLAGIVSFGFGCARANFYGVYTRVSTFVPWLEEQIGESLSSTVTAPTGASATILPEETTTLLLESAAGTINLAIAPGTVASPTELYWVDTPLTMPATNEMQLSNGSFTLRAVQNNQLVDHLVFQHPVTLTLTYRDEAVQSLDEDRLALWQLDPATGRWSDSTITILDHQPATNQLVVTVTQVAEYALGSRLHTAFLPVVHR